MIAKLEYWWRHRIVYPLLRMLFHNPRKYSPIDIHTIQKVLILRYDRIGDMIVTTPVFKGLKSLNPNLRIGVFASDANAEIIKYNPHVDTVYVLSSNWWQVGKEILKARKENYDVVLNLIFNRTSSGGILANLIAPKGMKIGQGAEKYYFYFNRLLNIKEDKQHIVKTHSKFIKESFGVDTPLSESNYEISVDDASSARVQLFCTIHGLAVRNKHTEGCKSYIILNVSASNQWTKLSVAQVDAMACHLSTKKEYGIVVIYAPGDREMREHASKLGQNTDAIIFPREGTATLLEIASLIEGSSCVITPDTSIAHFASAMNTPVLAFYSSHKENHEWLPHLVKNRLVISSENKPTSAIPIPEMIHAIDDFIRELTVADE
jgi:ADP-heptose:LPS heptosyltransferase